VFQADQSRLVYAQSEPDYLHIDPKLANGILASLAQYTPLLNESAVDLEKTLTPNQDAGFVGRDDAEHQFVTEATKLEIIYEVQGGDTITGIADKFGLHVATIAQRNDISIDEIENLKPGDAIVIPAADTSDSKEWLIALNEKKEAARQAAIAAAEKSRRNTRSKSTTRNRVASGFEGSAGTNFMVPISHNGISRGVSRYHAGIDYRATTGTAVKAGQSGKVIETTGGWAGGFGISVLVDHGGGMTSRYAHLSRVAVSAGDSVGQGDVVGYSGNTGYSTGPHLHFEVRKGGSVVTPF
jgi:murein DD-endopeptidase MepM/ murein hydrolase activator NlpD